MTTYNLIAIPIFIFLWWLLAKLIFKQTQKYFKERNEKINRQLAGKGFRVTLLGNKGRMSGWAKR